MKKIKSSLILGLISISLTVFGFRLSANDYNELSEFSYNTDPSEMKKGFGEVAGKIVSSKSNDPISYASVALLQEIDSSIVSGKISDENGEFVFSKVPYGNYHVQVSFVGYKPHFVNSISVSKKSRVVELAPLALTEDVSQIEEVVITAERLKGEEMIDRTAFTLNDDIRKISTTGLDVLKHIPSVQVDFQENVMLDGETNIQFYVDGVLRNKDFVAQLDPQIIDKVEVISNPGVKYDADISGVINIVMKKTKRFGVNGSVTIPIPHPEKILANPKANLEYGNNKFRVYAGTRVHIEKFNGGESLYTETDDSYVNPYTFYKESEGVNGWTNAYTNYGADWFISDKTTVNFLGEWRKGKGKKEDYLSTNERYEGDDELTQYFTSNLNGNNNRDNHYFSLFLKQQMPGEGSELTAEGYVYMHSSESRNSYEDIYYDPSNIETPIDELSRQDLTLNTSRTLEFKLDYTFNFKNIKNELGARFYNQLVDNDFTDEFSNEGNNGEYFENFKYTETRQTGYYNLLGTIKDVNWQLGFKGEHSLLDINDSITKEYFVWLPQLSLSRKFGKENTVKFTFRRQIYRPSAESLNPFTTWIDSLHVRTGNPDLDPWYRNLFELSYSKSFNNNYISPKVFISYKENIIQDLSIVNEDGITEITQANIGEHLKYGVGFNAAVQVLKRWRVNGNLSMYNLKVGSDYDLSLEEDDEKFSYRVGLTNIFMLPKDYAVFVYGYYSSPYISYQREHSRDLLVIFGFEKQFSKKAKVEVIYNPFIKEFTYNKVTTRSPGYYEEWEGYLDVHHLFTIEFTYNFNYGGKVNKMNRSADYDVDSGGGTF